MTHLDVTADLRIDVDGEPVHVRGHGDTLVVELPSVRAGRRRLAAEPASRDGLARADAALRDAGLTLDVRLRGVRLSRLGRGGHLGGLARLSKFHRAGQRTAEARGVLGPRPGLTLGLIAGAAGLVSLLFFARRR